MADTKVEFDSIPNRDIRLSAKSYESDKPFSKAPAKDGTWKTSPTKANGGSQNNKTTSLEPNTNASGWMPQNADANSDTPKNDSSNGHPLLGTDAGYDQQSEKSAGNNDFFQIKANEPTNKRGTNGQFYSNGATGSPSRDSGSLALTDEISIHLTPKQSLKTMNNSSQRKKQEDKFGTGTGRPGYPKNQTDQRAKPFTGRSTLGARTSAPKPIPKTNIKKPTKAVKPSIEPKEIKSKCGICEDFKVMRARCSHCQLNMCSECLEHHRRNSLSKAHDLQNMDRSPLYLPPASPMARSSPGRNCSIHRDEKLQFYCKVCRQPVCVSCKLTKHEGHASIDLHEAITDLRAHLPSKLSEIKTRYLPLLKKQVKGSDESTTSSKALHETRWSYGNVVSNRSKKYETDASDLDTWNNKQRRASTFKTDVKKGVINDHIRDATVAVTSGTRIARSGTDHEVMEMYQDLVNMTHQMQELTSPRKTPRHRNSIVEIQEPLPPPIKLTEKIAPKYASGAAIEPPTISSRSPRSLAALQRVPEIHARLLKSFTCKGVPGNKVSAIAPINDHEAWICFGWTTTEIYLYNKDGFRRKRLQLKQPVDDIAVDGEGNLVVSTFAGDVVKLIDRRLHVQDFLHVPLCGRGVTVSAAGEIIVCAVDKCTASPVPTKSAIFKFSPLGTITGHFEGELGKGIPVHPYRVAENIDGSVVIADWLNERDGRVVVFSRDGTIRNIYHGNASENRNFLPYGLCTDKFGHIIVGDIMSNQVHLLDIEGHFLLILLSRKDLTNERPYSLAVDSMGTLWVGNERANIKIFRYLVHQSHIIGPYVPPTDAIWNHSPFISPRALHHYRRTSIAHPAFAHPYYPYYDAPVYSFNHWRREEQARLRNRMYREIPNDYWRW